MASEILFQSSKFWIIPCILLGILFSLLFYYKASYKPPFRIFLSIIRGFLTAIIAVLLLNPLIKYLSNDELKPQIVLLIDDSQSMKFGGENNLETLKLKIEDIQNGLDDVAEVKIQRMSDLNEVEKKEDLRFESKNSNFSRALNSITSNYEGQNLQEVILISDGIITDGISPANKNYPFRISTIGFGDETSKKDTRIAGINSNKIAFIKSKFSVSVDIASYGYAGKTTEIQIRSESGSVVSKQSLRFNNEEDFKTVSFEVLANQIGKIKYNVELKPLDGEFSKSNNKKEFFVEIKDGKEKILIVAAAPHPDLKALKSILDKNELYETAVIVQPTEIPKNEFDVLILHQLPTMLNPAMNSIVTALAKQKKACLYVLGGQSSIPVFNENQRVLSIPSNGRKLDKIGPFINTKFVQFQFLSNSEDIFNRLPPAFVPFGDYKLKAGSEAILLQRLGNINTNKPILAYNINEKSAVLVAEGIWQWRLEEYAFIENQNVVDDCILKTLQLISTKDNSSKLRVFPMADSYELDQKVQLGIETYNSILDKIVDQKISINVKGPKAYNKTYEIQNSSEVNSLELSGLPSGVYTFKAKSTILGKNETAEGQFIVTETNPELLNPKADFDFLKLLAKETGGRYLPFNNMTEISKILNKNNTITKLIAKEDLVDLINFKSILAFLLLLASIEWFTRKYTGKY